MKGEGLICNTNILTDALNMRNGLVTASGILSIIAAFLAIARGFISLDGGVIELTQTYNPRVSGMLFYGGIIGIVAFAFGLIGGILALRRGHFPIVIIGFALLIVESLSLWLFNIEFGAWVIFAQFGLPVLVMSLIGVVFAGVGRSEFK